MTDEEIIKQFKDLGNEASYHYADDSGKEWKLGDAKRKNALTLFDSNPNLQDKLRDVAERESFLWSLDYYRPWGKEDA